MRGQELEILKFPGEEARSAEIYQTLRNEFDVADRLYRNWARVDIDRWLAQNSLDIKVISVAMMLAIQATRLFRSILEECRRAEGMSAMILSRSLFETAVALEFVLAPAIRIKTVKLKKPDQFGQARYEARIGGNRSKPLSRELRATLFRVCTSLHEEQHVEKVLSTKGLKRFGRSQKKKVNPKTIKVIEKEIGPEWASILRETPSYSGLSIRQTAALTGKLGKMWYALGYPLQCRASHAVDAWKMTDVDKDGTVNATAFSDDADVGFALYCGTGFFLAVLSTLEEHIGFGMKNILPALDSEAAKIYKRVKPK